MNVTKNLKILDTFVLIENIVCIYRNFSVKSMTSKIFVSLRISIEVTLTTFVYVWNLMNLYSGMYDNRLRIIFQTFSFLSSMVMIFNGLLFSKTFVSLTKNIQHVYIINLGNNTLITTIKKIKIALLVQGTIYITSRLILSGSVWRSVIYHLYDEKIVTVHNIYNLLIGALYGTWVQTRSIIEFAVFFALIFIIGSLFKILNERVVMTLNELDNLEHKNKTDIIKVSTVKEWVIVYRHLLDSCKQLHTCFAIQVKYYFIYLNLLVSERFITSHSYRCENTEYEYVASQMAVTFCYQVVSIVPIMVAGQRLNNQFAILKKSLAKMNNLLIVVPDTPEYKEVKDFLHFLRLNSVELKLLSYPIGMAMLPTSFGVVVSYVVIALQFNHVV
nr:uncharacterized protein LOC128683957 [Plodia interpunctella]